MSTSWMECSIRHPPPACGHVGPPLRPVGALDREVLVVAEDRRHGLAERPPGHQLTQGPEHGRAAQHQAALARHPRRRHRLGQRLSPRPGRGRAASRRTPRRRRPPPSSTASRWAPVGVQTHTASARAATSAAPAATTTSAPPTRRRRPGPAPPRGSWTATMEASITPPSIIAFRPSPCAQAMTPVPTKPMRSMPPTLGSGGSPSAHGRRPAAPDEACRDHDQHGDLVALAARGSGRAGRRRR